MNLRDFDQTDFDSTDFGLSLDFTRTHIMDFNGCYWGGQLNHCAIYALRELISYEVKTAFYTLFFIFLFNILNEKRLWTPSHTVGVWMYLLLRKGFFPGSLWGFPEKRNSYQLLCARIAIYEVLLVWSATDLKFSKKLLDIELTSATQGFHYSER